MILLISQDKHAGLNYNPTHFIKGEQLFKLTAIDFKTALINEMFENPRSKTTFRALMYKITPPSSSVRSPIHMEPTPFKKGTKPDDPPQNVDKSHVSAPISTITNLYITCTLDTSCDQLLHLDPPWHSSDPQDISSVENIKLNFFLNLKYNWTMPTFHQQMFSLGTMIMICSYPTKRLIPHLTISTLRTLMSVKMKISSLSMPPTFSHTIALPQFMAQHNYEGLKPTGTPSAVSTAIQASNDHPFNPWCGRNPMATQCNQSQYPNLDYNFAQPQLMAQPNFEDLDPTDNPSAVPTNLQASSDHTLNTKCAHNLMATQSNQSQYLTSLNKSVLITHLQVRTTRSACATLWLHHTHLILGSMF